MAKKLVGAVRGHINYRPDCGKNPYEAAYGDTVMGYYQSRDVAQIAIDEYVAKNASLYIMKFKCKACGVTVTCRNHGRRRNTCAPCRKEIMLRDFVEYNSRQNDADGY